MENKFVVDYDKKIVTLHYRGEAFEFDLNEGDVGDFWSTFTDSKNVIRDINFHQEDANESANLSVYPVNDEGGELVVDTSEATAEHLSSTELIGNPANYFGENNEL